MALTKVNNRMIDGATVNVLDFGAVGDGVTDDSAAIQAAFAAVSSGGVVEFPHRTDSDLPFRIENIITVNPNADADIRVIGNNARLEFNIADIAAASDATGGFFLLHCTGGAGNRLWIENLNIQNPNQVALPTLIGNANLLHINNWEKVFITGTTIQNANRTCLWITTISEQASITDCFFDGGLFSGCLFQDCVNVNFDENITQNHGRSIDRGYGVMCNFKTGTTDYNRRITITNNKVYNCYRKGIDVHQGELVVISNNIVEAPNALACHGGIFALLDDGENKTKEVIIDSNYVKCSGAVYYTVYAGSDENTSTGYKFGNLVISNNILHGSNGSNLQIGSDYGVPENVVVSGNAFYQDETLSYNTYADILVASSPLSNIYNMSITGNSSKQKLGYFCSITGAYGLSIVGNSIRGTTAAQALANHMLITSNVSQGAVTISGNTLNVNTAISLNAFNITDAQNVVIVGNNIHNAVGAFTNFNSLTNVSNNEVSGNLST